MFRQGRKGWLFLSEIQFSISRELDESIYIKLHSVSLLFCLPPYTKDVCPPHGYGGHGDGGHGGLGGIGGHGRQSGHGRPTKC